jgi:hypothetical protein
MALDICYRPISRRRGNVRAGARCVLRQSLPVAIANRLCLVRFGCPSRVVRVDLACRQHVRLRGNLRNAGRPALPVEGIGLDVIQAPKRGPRIMRYDLTDFEWAAIRLLLPNKPRGIRVDDQRVLNGIFWVIRSGAPSRDLPVSLWAPRHLHNRFVRCGTARGT